MMSNAMNQVDKWRHVEKVGSSSKTPKTPKVTSTSEDEGGILISPASAIKIAKRRLSVRALRSMTKLQ